jgi:hypothetical protein
MESVIGRDAISKNCSPDPRCPSNSDAQQAEVARSEENVREWMAYLPQDCVEAMIQMGWDLST